MDFQIKEKWCFFATSHGKSPCDGIGGTLKRLAARASLQRTKTEQILTPLDMRLSESHVCMFLPSQNIEAVQYKMEERYASAKTIPGTRSYHEFVPLNNGETGLKRISDQEHFDSVYSFVPKPDQEINMTAEIQIG